MTLTHHRTERSELTAATTEPAPEPQGRAPRLPNHLAAADPDPRRPIPLQGTPSLLDWFRVSLAALVISVAAGLALRAVVPAAIPEPVAVEAALPSEVPAIPPPVPIQTPQQATEVAEEPPQDADDPVVDTALPAETVEPIAAAAARIGPAVVKIEHLEGQGSGVIYSTEGYILTAAHVVEGVTTVTIRFADGTRIEGEVLGAHEPTDVAVVKIGADPALPVAELALGAQLQVGQLAVALGSPFGLDLTVTAGILSAVDRLVDDVSMLQTDAAINPGNSGGPLVDGLGRVIGINVQIRTSGGGNDGIGFAVSIDLAKLVADQIVRGGDVQLSFLGVTPAPAPNGDAGVLVEEVADGTAAADAGIEVGDLIVAFDDRPIRDESDLRIRVLNTAPGQTVEIEVLRDGDSLTLTPTLGGAIA